MSKRMPTQKDKATPGSPLIENAPPYISNRRSLKMPSCSVSLDDLSKLFKTLHEKVNEAADIEVDSQTKSPEATNKEFEEHKKLIRELCKVVVYITGVRGEQIIGHTEKVFDSENLPDQVATVLFDSSAYYKLVLSKEPLNHFAIFFDFSKLHLLDLSNPSEAPTTNTSNLQVVGSNETWVSGVYEKLNLFINARKLKRNWPHTHYIYDVLLFFLGIPLAFWVVYRINRILKPYIQNWPSALEVAFYIYIVFAILYIFRLFFNYTRWAFPLTEYSTQFKDSSRKHRYIWSLLGSSLLVALIYDILKLLFL